MIRKLVILGCVAAVVFAVLYFLCYYNVEPVKTWVGPYMDQAFAVIGEQVGKVQELVAQYSGQILGVIASATGGIVLLIKNYFNRQKDNMVKAVTNEANEQIMNAESELAKALKLNQNLEGENSVLRARLQNLEDVEGNMNSLREQLDKKIEEIERLTTERNALERLSVDKIADAVVKKEGAEKVVE